MTLRLRLAEVLGSLSLATDLASGCPPESGLRATIVATRLGELVGLSHDELAVTYYAGITRMLGCTSTAMEGASLALGEDQILNFALLSCDWADPAEVEAALERYLTPDVSAQERRSAVAGIVEMHASIVRMSSLHCAQAALLTGRLPVPAGVPVMLEHLWARWDGRFPGAAGTDIPLPARIITLARAAELARRPGGPEAADAVVRSRSGTEFDPDLCTALHTHARELLEGLDAPSAWDLFLDTEPRSHVLITPEQMVTVAETFADFVDQKSGWFAGHSRRVAALAGDAAVTMGLASGEQDRIRLGGLVHDIGRAAVSNGIWDKPAPLTPREYDIAESHSYHSECVLRAAPALNELASLASAAHERADGSGYHRRVRAVESAVGLLGAADVYEALTHDRPWRSAFPTDAASREMQAMSADGLLNSECVAAVLGQGRAGDAVVPTYPAGLTPREVEVLRLVVMGLPTKAIAARLFISIKTADHHIQNIYEKTGARGRAVAALFAVEHGLTVN